MNLFITLLAIYIIAMLGLGYMGSKKAKSVAAYATSSGDVSPFATAITFAACFASAGTFLGVAGQGFAFGVTNVWFWASQWTTCGIILAIVVKRYRRTSKNLNSLTVADWIADRYNSQGLRLFLALVSMLQVLYIASQLVGAGIIVNQMIPAVSYKAAVMLSALVIIIYISMGGTYAHIYTNVAQGAMMVVISVAIMIAGFFLFGNIFTEVPARLAAIDPALAQGLNPKNGGYPTWIHVVALFISHFWWALNPQLINKATYLKNDRDVKKFIYYNAILMFLMGCVVLGGSYTRILVPEGIGKTIPGMDGAIPYFVANVFPSTVSAIFLIVIIAAMMSTVDGILLYMSSVIGNTMYKQLYVKSKINRGEIVDQVKVDRVTMKIMQWSTVFIGLVAAPLAFSKPANLTALLWTAAGTIMSSVAGPVCVGIYSKKPSAKAAALGSLGGCLIYCVLYFGKVIPSVYLCCGIGGLASVALTILGIYIFKPMDQAYVNKIFESIEAEEVDIQTNTIQA